MLSVAVISVAVVADVYSVESSTYIDTLALLKDSGMSLVKKKESKSKGHEQLPWGIPDSKWIIFERLPLTSCQISKRFYGESTPSDYVRSAPSHKKTYSHFPAKERSTKEEHKK